MRSVVRDLRYTLRTTGTNQQLQTINITLKWSRAYQAHSRERHNSEQNIFNSHLSHSGSTGTVPVVANVVNKNCKIVK